MIPKYNEFSATVRTPPLPEGAPPGSSSPMNSSHSCSSVNTPQGQIYRSLEARHQVLNLPWAKHSARYHQQLLSKFFLSEFFLKEILIRSHYNLSFCVLLRSDQIKLVALMSRITAREKELCWDMQGTPI